jgi:hypothetical protein
MFRGTRQELTNLCETALTAADSFNVCAARIKGETMATQMSKAQLIEKIATTTELS